jgi:hypothetical protein
MPRTLNYILAYRLEDQLIRGLDDYIYDVAGELAGTNDIFYIEEEIKGIMYPYRADE